MLLKRLYDSFFSLQAFTFEFSRGFIKLGKKKNLYHKETPLAIETINFTIESTVFQNKHFPAGKYMFKVKKSFLF